MPSASFANAEPRRRYRVAPSGRADTHPAWRLVRAAKAGLRLGWQRIDRAALHLPAPLELSCLARRHARGLLESLGVELRVFGVLPAADRPLLLVANHVSWLDTYALNAVNGARFIAKSEVGAWPLIGTIASRFGTIFHRRGCFRDAWRTVAAARRALALGYPVGVFPEGTTTRGDELLEFRPAFFQAAIDIGVPVQPVAIRYCFSDGTPTAAASYSGDTSLLDSVLDVLRCRRLVVELHFAARLAPYDDRRALAASARKAIFCNLWPERIDHLGQRFPRRRKVALDLRRSA